MDFGVLDGLVSSENNTKNTMISCGDLDLKSKWFGSGGGFCKQENSVSATSAAAAAAAGAIHGDEWRELKMAKIGEDDISKAMLLQQQRSNDAQNMLSFSSPNTQTVTFPYYYARNNTGYGAGGPFTPSQWMELEHQALIYKYITANAAIPSNLLIPIRKALETTAFSAYSGAHLRHNSFGWGALHLGFCNSSDPEPGRCRRTDGKKWRCAKDAVADQKYCERHMNRGRHRSRKPVEAQTCHSQPTNNSTKITATATAAASTVLRHTSTGTQSAASSQDNRSVLNKANMEASVVPILSSSSTGLKKNQLSTPEESLGRSEFGLVCSDSLLNPMHKTDPKSQNSLHQFMEDWPHSNQAQLSISISSTTSPNLSPLRMGLGMGKGANEVHNPWETSLGGPLGEVLQHSTSNSPSALNLMTEGWGQ